MTWNLQNLDVQLTETELEQRLDQLTAADRPRFARLWAYYRNPMTVRAALLDSSSDRPYRQAQEWGLPARITGYRALTSTVSPVEEGPGRKEVVIENDIGWRIESMVDYLFGKPIVLCATASNDQRRTLITELLRRIIDHNGGIQFLQQLALTGAIYGFVDVLVKMERVAGCELQVARVDAPHLAIVDAPPATPDSNPPLQYPAPLSDSQEPTAPDPASISDRIALDDFQNPGALSNAMLTRLDRVARMIHLEIVEPARALAFLSPTDWQTVAAYGQYYQLTVSQPLAQDGKSRPSLFRRWFGRKSTGWTLAHQPTDEPAKVLELITPTRWRKYINGVIVQEGTNPLGRIPLVHIQNTAIPFEYAGASDVEPLIPLQDELNTRLSDRAHRIALQSMKMYLGKGIENFLDQPIGPGRMWSTSNDQADIVQVGGDAACPSEDVHIADVREAIDKSSAVSPIAAGAIKNRLGRLTSAAALRVTLNALLAKTERKRSTYGGGLGQLCELSLAALDQAGVFATSPDERRIEIHWPSPLPENDQEKLQEAEAKVRLGVPREVVLKELGY